MTSACAEESWGLEDLIIRKVTKTDLPALEWDGALIHFRRMFADLYHYMQRGQTLMWMVETPGGEMIGQAFVMLKSSDRAAADGERRAYIFAFRIKPHWRSRGVGTHLMRFIERDLYARGFRFATLNVAKNNFRALRLYRRLGYKVVGSQPGKWSFKDHEGRIQHREEPAWRMMRHLDGG